MLQVELFRSAVLAPPLGVPHVVEDERGAGAAGSNECFLQRPRVARSPLVLDVVRDAPAAAVDPIVALDEVGERIPRARIQPSRRVLGQGRVSAALSLRP